MKSIALDTNLNDMLNDLRAVSVVRTITARGTLAEKVTTIRSIMGKADASLRDALRLVELHADAM